MNNAQTPVLELFSGGGMEGRERTNERIKMLITIYRNGEAWRTFKADEIDITLGETLDTGAIFLVSQSGDDGIHIDSEVSMVGEFGEDSITLRQPVSV